MDLHTQPLTTSENSPPCPLTSENFNSSGVCSSETNDCTAKPKSALPASVETVTIPVTTGYVAGIMEPIELREDEFYALINHTDYSLSHSELRVLSMGLEFTPNPPNVDRLNLK